MYISAEGAQAQATRMEVLANNLANINTPGYKRDVASFQSRLAEAIEQGQDQVGTGTVNQVGGGVKMGDVQTDFSPGTLKHTAIPTDLAIGGAGFFEVQSATGEVYLTRAGNFTLNALGELVTQTGRHHVLDASSAPIRILAGEPWHVSPEGFVVQGSGGIPLSVVMPQSLDQLTKVGENLFRPEQQVTQLDLAQRQVRQGYLELSSVSPTLEMMTLIETSRAFEANTKLIQNQDHMLGSLISRVLQS
jgi:flagellar basal body rod protein FlgG